MEDGAFCGPSPMKINFGEEALLLLFVAAVVALLTRRLRLPYSVGLVLAGMAMGALPVAQKIELTKELIFSALLPPLIFEAAFHLRWSELRRELALILTLASAGVAISGAVVGAGMHYAAQWPWPASLVFGALIAATDPVAVLDTFREAKAQGRLRLLMEAESLLNDGTAAVAFGAAVVWAAGQSLTGFAVAGGLVADLGGSLLCGAVVAGAMLFLVRRTEDHLVELSFTAVAAYGSFLLAEQLHFSGVLSTIVAGLIIGNWGPLGALTVHGREAVDAFWEYAAFAANSLVFLLIGMRETTQHFAAVWPACAIAIGVVLVGRAAAVYPLCALFARSELRVTARHRHALFWGGLRGALALALALGLPEDFPAREEVITVSFAVVAFSIFAQGLTMPAVLRGMGEVPKRAR
jgi:CPA1 family monovalent cation:H+ antiporter